MMILPDGESTILDMCHYSDDNKHNNILNVPVEIDTESIPELIKQMEL